MANPHATFATDGATLYHGEALTLLPYLAERHPPPAAIICDPPYSSGGQFRGDRAMPARAKYQDTRFQHLHQDFSGDNRDQRSFVAWCALWLEAARAWSEPGALVALFTDWRQLPTLSDALQAGGWIWRGVVPWDKTEATRPALGRYRSQCEFVLWGTNGPRPMEGHAAPGLFRLPPDPADLPDPGPAGPQGPGILTGATNSEGPKEHMTGKPVRLMEQLLLPVRPGGPVLDLFAGSCPVGRACLRTGRPYVGTEIDGAIFERAADLLKQEAAQPRLALRLGTPNPEANQAQFDLSA